MWNPPLGICKPQHFLLRVDKNLSLPAHPCLEGHRILKAGASELLQSHSQDGAPQELNQSHTVLAAGKARGNPGVPQLPWLLLCQVMLANPQGAAQHKRQPWVGTTITHPAGIPLDKSPIIVFSSCVCSARKDKGAHYFLCSVTLQMKVTFLTAVIWWGKQGIGIQKLVMGALQMSGYPKIAAEESAASTF